MTTATSENLYQIDSFADHITAPEISILQPDVSKPGGDAESRPGLIAIDLVDLVDRDAIGIK